MREINRASYGGRRDKAAFLTYAGCRSISALRRLPMSMPRVDALITGVRQLNPVFRDFRTDFPVFTRVPAAVFKSTCGGTSCKYGAFIDMT
jgi:hypothetical protein